MKLFIATILLLIAANSMAQYSTPGTGVNWNLDSLTTYSDGSFYVDTFYEDIIISTNDSLTISSTTLWAEDGVTITVFGGLYVNDCSFDPNFGAYLEGFRLEETSNVIFDGNDFATCGGIKVITPNFIFQNNNVSDCPALLTTGGFIELSNGSPVITNNAFYDCEVSAISSAANSSVSPIIENNTFSSNVESNTNRPQINLGPSGSSDTTKIINNIINNGQFNEMVGAIAFSSLVGGDGNIVISDNTISNNRYGIAIIGNNLNAFIDNNTIIDNNIQNEPNLGGSGINLNGNSTSNAVLSNNTIENNLWGVTVQGTFNVAMGDNDIDQTSPGGNYFSNNGNGGELYALFNNTPNEISAMHNCWETSMESTLDIAETVISHSIDDASLGTVIFDPLGINCVPDGVNDPTNFEAYVSIFPVPSKGDITVNFNKSLSISKLEVYGLNGQLFPVAYHIKNQAVLIKTEQLESGFYFINLNFEGIEICKKFIVQ